MLRINAGFYLISSVLQTIDVMGMSRVKEKKSVSYYKSEIRSARELVVVE